MFYKKENWLIAEKLIFPDSTKNTEENKDQNKNRYEHTKDI